MKIYLDTSSLFKLYHKEHGTNELMDLFNENKIETLYLAEITKIEFCSVVWKKCRKMDIDEEKANILIDKFEKDLIKFTIVPESIFVKKNAIKSIRKHWRKGLRTLDSIQLASALEIKEQVDLFVSSDKILLEISEIEGFTIRK